MLIWYPTTRQVLKAILGRDFDDRQDLLIKVRGGRGPRTAHAFHAQAPFRSESQPVGDISYWNNQ